MAYEVSIISEMMTKRYMQEYETLANRYEGFERFFEVEGRLIQEIHSLETEKAKQTLIELVDVIAIRAGKQTIPAVKRYFYVLTDILARKLADSQVPPKKVLAFGTVCIEMIEHEMKDAQFLEFSESLIDFFIEVISERKQPAFSHQTINKVILYINDMIETDLSVEEIAKHFKISTSHLSRIFRENVGLTLVEYLNIRRIEESQYYLRHSPKTITEISNQFHFCNQSYFTRIFKKYVHVTPKQFRDHVEHEFFRYHLDATK